MRPRTFWERQIIDDDRTHGRTMVLQLGPGDIGTRETLEAMAAFVVHTDETGHVRNVVAEIAAGEEQKDLAGQLAGVDAFLRDHVRFMRDPAGRELVRHPDQLLREIADSERALTSADCDDVATLGAAMVRALGFTPVFVVMSPDARDQFRHVSFGVRLKTGKIVNLDPQERVPVGRLPDAVAGGRLGIFDFPAQA